jgi:hypothetical protein
MTDENRLTQGEQRVVDSVASQLFVALYMAFASENEQRGLLDDPGEQLVRRIARTAFAAAFLYGHERHLACEHCPDRSAP